MSEENTEVQSAPQLSIQDLVSAANIINLATQRGAFNASEAETVGTVFNKVQRLTREVAAMLEEQNDSEESASQTDEAEEA